MKNYQKIVNMRLEELAREFVVPFTYMCGYRAQTTFRAVHTGTDYDTKEEALDAEVAYLNSETKE